MWTEITLFVLGVAIGGILFCRVQPRPICNLSDCKSSSKEIAGVLASLGFQYTPYLAPGLVAVTDQCVVIKHPKPAGSYHVVAFPRIDVKDVGDMTTIDISYVMDCLVVFQSLIRENDLKQYRILTNGPGFQDVSLLHFHLISNDSFPK